MAGCLAIGAGVTLAENVKSTRTRYRAVCPILIQEISEHIESINSNVTKLINERKKANSVDDISKKALDYCNKVKPVFDDIRYHCDKLELLVDDELWPLTKYRELLFTR